jgi:hypothetical protein
LDAVTAAQPPPLEVNVNVTVPVNAAGGVYAAFRLLAAGVKTPPTPPSDHVPPEAPPETLPPSGGVDPPWQMAFNAGPADTVGLETVMVPVAVVPVQPPTGLTVYVNAPFTVGVPEIVSTPFDEL